MCYKDGGTIMDVNFDKGIVRLYEKNYKLETVLKRLSLLSGEQVYHFLNNRCIQIPRIFNCYALISVLNHKIKFLHSKSLSKDYFTRLQYYKYFTEQQLFNLFRKICNDDVSFQMYRYNFFKLLLLNFVGMNLNDGEIIYLKNLKKGSMESFEEYFNYISMVSLEVEGSFDGRNIVELKEMLPLSASNQDIYDVAGKYGIDLPTRLKKKQFLDFIIYHMRKNNEYSDAMALELEAMTMTQLQTYARRTGVPMQPAMGKTELVTYLFYYLEQCSMEYTSFSRVVINSLYEPLDFTVDFSAINAFQADDATKVIHYEGEENDIEEFNQVLLEEDIDDEEVPEELVEEKPIEEAPLEESPLEEANEPSNNESEADTIEDASDDSEADSIEASNEDNEADAIEDSSDLASDDEDLEDGGFSVSYIDSDYQREEEASIEDESNMEDTTPNPEEEPQHIEEAEEISDEEIDSIIKSYNESKEEKKDDLANEVFNDVRKNESYGDERIIKNAKNSSKKGIIITAVLVILLALGIVAYFMLRK